jgi:hypothetical protein
VEHNGQAVSLGQMFYRPAQIEGELSCFYGTSRRWQLLRIGNHTPTPPFANDIVSSAGYYTGKPRAKEFVLPQLSDGAKGGNKRFLYRILGVAPILQQGKGNSISPGGVISHQLSEALPITFFSPANKTYFIHHFAELYHLAGTFAEVPLY